MFVLNTIGKIHTDFDQFGYKYKVKKNIILLNLSTQFFENSRL